MGFKAERRAFRPHLTLGRVKGGRPAGGLRAAAGGLADAEFGLEPATELVVFSSELSRHGPTYAALDTAGLGGEHA